MTRELKLALIVGFSLVLLVTVLISDHLSSARKAQLEAGVPDQPAVLAAAREPIVTIVQGAGGGITGFQPSASADAANWQLGPERTSTHLLAEQPGTSPQILQELGDRVGDVVAGATRPEPLIDTTAMHLNPPMIDVSQQPTLLPEPVANRVQQAKLDVQSGLTTPGGAMGATGLPPTNIAQVNPTPLTLTATEVLSASSKVQPASAKPAADDRWHTVAKGETATSIARRYYGLGSAWKRLAERNGNRIGPKGEVRVGVRLRIPSFESLGLRQVQQPAIDPQLGAILAHQPDLTRIDVTPRKSQTTRSDRAKPAKTRTYTVRKGDTLGVIAQRELGTVRRTREILTLNRLADADHLRTGMTLLLPAT